MLNVEKLKIRIKNNYDKNVYIKFLILISSLELSEIISSYYTSAYAYTLKYLFLFIFIAVPIKYLDTHSIDPLSKKIVHLIFFVLWIIILLSPL